MGEEYFAYRNVSYKIESNSNRKLLFKKLKKVFKAYFKQINKSKRSKDELLGWMIRLYIWVDLCVTHTYLDPENKYHYLFGLDKDNELNVRLEIKGLKE